MTQTLAPVLPFTPRATRQRKPNRRPGAIPLDTSFAAIVADLASLGDTPDSIRSLAALDPDGKDDLHALAALMEQQASLPCPA